MKNVSSYLEKFKHIKPPKRTVLNKFIEVVYEVCGVKLKNFEIGIQNHIVFVTTNPTIKSEIVLNKGEILRKLNESGHNSIKEIR